MNGFPIVLPTAHPVASARLSVRVVFVAVAVVWMAVGVTRAQHQVRLPSGEIVEGSRIAIDEAGNYQLTTPRGDLSFPPGTPVVVAEPPEFTQAVQRQRQGRHDEAIRLLQQVIEQYPRLQWDAPARILLADSFHARGDFARAADVFAQIQAESPEALRDESRRARYIESLRKSDRMEELLAFLDRTIRAGDRAAAAQAQMLRGDLKRQRGDEDGAVLDFLRTVELFQDVDAVQNEALEKTVASLRLLGHPEADVVEQRLQERRRRVR